MNQVFSSISVSGIVKPGQVYILYENESRGYSPEPIEFLYTIRSDEEILRALDMEVCVVGAENWELRKFLGAREISGDCYELKFMVYVKDEECEKEQSMYLHRVLSFEEQLREMLELFSK